MSQEAEPAGPAGTTGGDGPSADTDPDPEVVVDEAALLEKLEAQNQALFEDSKRAVKLSPAARWRVDSSGRVPKIARVTSRTLYLSLE